MSLGCAKVSPESKSFYVAKEIWLCRSPLPQGTPDAEGMCAPICWARTLVPQKWVGALTSTVPSALNCSHAVCGENAQISNSSLYWWCYFWSSWHKWAWLCKIEVSNQLAPTNGLCSFLLPLSKAQIWGWSDSGTPWTLAKHAWPRHRCEKKVPIPWRQRYKLKNILQRKYNHGKLQQRCYSENLLFPPPTARETPF